MRLEAIFRHVAPGGRRVERIVTSSQINHEGVLRSSAATLYLGVRSLIDRTTDRLILGASRQPTLIGWRAQRGSFMTPLNAHIDAGIRWLDHRRTIAALAGIMDGAVNRVSG